MIPYGTVAEAALALGRGLTWAEATWFRYSAAMPDHWLLWHNTLILFLAHVLVPLPLALLERLAPAFAMRYKLQLARGAALPGCRCPLLQGHRPRLPARPRSLPDHLLPRRKGLSLSSYT